MINFHTSAPIAKQITIARLAKTLEVAFPFSFLTEFVFGAFAIFLIFKFNVVVKYDL